MAYAGLVTGYADVRVPRLSMPRFLRLRLPPHTRFLLMIGIMISPCFLADTYGYWIQRMVYTSDQMVARQRPDAILAQIHKFDVACAVTDMSATDQGRWARDAAQQGWPLYPEAGPGCYKPDRNLRGIIGLKVFSVACPTVVLSALDQRRWATYAAAHDWGPYPQAGDGCVDP